MLDKYAGPIAIQSVHAVVDVTATQAIVDTTYELSNPTRKAIRASVEAARPALAPLTARAPASALPARPAIALGPTPERATTRLHLGPGASRLVDLRSAFTPPTGRIGSAQLFPSLRIDGKFALGRVATYEATFVLPRHATRTIFSSTPTQSVKRLPDGRLQVVIRRTKSHLLPISLKWTTVDADISVTKSAKQGPQNTLRIQLTVRNRGKTAAAITLRDDWCAGDIIPARQTGFTLDHSDDRDPRQVWSSKLTLEPGKRATRVYTVRCRALKVRVPHTEALVSKRVAAIGRVPTVFHFSPPPGGLSTVALALPSGWSFNHVDSDRHLNQHALTDGGQVYSATAGKLAWMTMASYGDKDMADGILWSVEHQILRFANASLHHGSSGWMYRNGTESTHTFTFQHDDLKRSPIADVFLTGWGFDFTSGDRHINQIKVCLERIAWDRSAGRVTWTARVKYADKNWDDNYRFRYQWAVLGHDGQSHTKRFSQSHTGGATTKKHEFQDSALSSVNTAIVVPVGWDFDYDSGDHHIDEHQFALRNVAFDKANGKVSWTAHASYGDKDRQDDYSWRYDVLVIGTNSGASRTTVQGPFIHPIGADIRPAQVDLDALFEPVTWENGIMDGTETAVDAGGSSPIPVQALVLPLIPGTAASADLFSLQDPIERSVVQTVASSALIEYALDKGEDPDAFYEGVLQADRMVEAVAWYVDRNMAYLKDSGDWNGPQSAYRILTESGTRGTKAYQGDCEDHAILRASLLRSLGFSPKAIFCADHHNSTDQGQLDECGGVKKSGGHTYNVVVYRNKYRIMDYGAMQPRTWDKCWDQHATDNLWNDHYGQYWYRQDVSPFGAQPLVNYPGAPLQVTWDWRTYYADISR